MSSPYSGTFLWWLWATSLLHLPLFSLGGSVHVGSNGRLELLFWRLRRWVAMLGNAVPIAHPSRAETNTSFLFANL